MSRRVVRSGPDGSFAHAYALASLAASAALPAFNYLTGSRKRPYVGAPSNPYFGPSLPPGGLRPRFRARFRAPRSVMYHRFRPRARSARYYKRFRNVRYFRKFRK